MNPLGVIEVEHHHDDLWVVTLAGEYDLSNAHQIEQKLADVHTHGTRVVLDLSRTTFMDSTVVGVILQERHRAATDPDNALAVVAPDGSPARRILDLVHLRGVLLAESLEDAVTGLSAGGAQPAG